MPGILTLKVNESNKIVGQAYSPKLWQNQISSDLTNLLLLAGNHGRLLCALRLELLNDISALLQLLPVACLWHRNIKNKPQNLMHFQRKEQVAVVFLGRGLTLDEQTNDRTEELVRYSFGKLVGNTVFEDLIECCFWNLDPYILETCWTFRRPRWECVEVLQVCMIFFRTSLRGSSRLVRLCWKEWWEGEMVVESLCCNPFICLCSMYVNIFVHCERNNPLCDMINYIVQ